MRFFLSLLPFATLLLHSTMALPQSTAETEVVKRDFGAVWYGAPKCNDKWTHCVYMEDSIYTHGPEEVWEHVTCSELTPYGDGVKKCQFDTTATAKIRCDGEHDHSYILVVFGEKKSSFKVYGDQCKAYWSSKKNYWHRESITETFESGDDLYVYW